MTNILGVLHKALADAVELDLIDKNPCPILHGGGDLRASPDPFTREEVVQILAEIDVRWRPFYRFWFGSGMRSSEIVALRFSGIDWNHPAVEVRFGRSGRLGVEAIATASSTQQSCGPPSVRAWTKEPLMPRARSPIRLIPGMILGVAAATPAAPSWRLSARASGGSHS